MEVHAWAAVTRAAAACAHVSVRRGRNPWGDLFAPHYSVGYSTIHGLGSVTPRLHSTARQEVDVPGRAGPGEGQCPRGRRVVLRSRRGPRVCTEAAPERAGAPPLPGAQGPLQNHREHTAEGGAGSTLTADTGTVPGGPRPHEAHAPRRSEPGAQLCRATVLPDARSAGGDTRTFSPWAQAAGMGVGQRGALRPPWDRRGPFPVGCPDGSYILGEVSVHCCLDGLSLR